MDQQEAKENFESALLKYSNRKIGYLKHVYEGVDVENEAGEAILKTFEFRNSGRMRNPESWRTFYSRILTNACIDQTRAKRPISLTVLANEDEEEGDSLENSFAAEDPRFSEIDREDEKEVSIRQFAKNNQIIEVLRLKALHCTHEKISEMTGICVNTVGGYVKRFKKFLERIGS